MNTLYRPFITTLASFLLTVTPLILPETVSEEDQLMQTLQESVGTLLDGKNDFSVERYDVSKKGEGYHLEGTGTIMGNPGITLAADFASLTQLSSLSAVFPPNSTLSNKSQKTLTGERITKRAPKDIAGSLSAHSFTMGFSGKKVSSLELIMNSSPWRLIDQTDISMKDIQVSFRVDNPTAKNPRITSRISGNIPFSNSLVALTGEGGNSREDWTFSGDVNNIQVGGLINSTGLDRPQEIPAEIWKFGISNGKMFVALGRKTFSLQGLSDLGQVEFQASPDSKGKTLQYMLGFSPPQDFRFSSINPDFSMLDNLKLTNTALVLASARQVSNLALFQHLGQSPTVDRGLTLLSSYRIDQVSPELSRLMGQSNLLLRGTLSNKVAEMKLEAELNTNIHFDDRGNVVMKGVVFTMRPTPSNMKISLGGMMDVKANQDLLHFRANVGVDVTNLTLTAEGFMEGEWSNPFGLSPGVHIADLGLGFGVTFKTTPIPLPTLAMAGKLKVGNSRSPKFSGDVAVAIDPSNPLNCMVDAGFNRIAFSDIIEACASGTPVPADLRNTISSISIDDARLTVVPNPAGMVLFNKTYDHGYLIQGKANMGKQYIQIKVDVGDNGVEAFGGMSAIRHDPYFVLTGSRGEPNPFMYINLKKGEKNGLRVTGRAQVLGLVAETDMTLHDRGFDLYMNGQIFHVFHASLALSGGDISNGNDFYVKATMKNDLFDYITRKASMEIDRATQKTQEDIIAAQQTLTNEQKKLNGLYKEVERQRAIVRGERERDCKKVSDAETAVTSAQNSVNSLNGQISSVNKTISNLKSEMKKNPLKVPENTAKIGYYGTQLAGLETAKATAWASLEAAKYTLKGIGVVCDKTPIDIDPRVAGLVTAIESSKLTIEGAKLVLEGGKIIGVGSLGAAKWIVEKGNPLGVVNITYAEFESKLNVANSGMVAMKVKGTFAGKPLDTSFSFNFNSPQATVEAWARSLVK